MPWLAICVAFLAGCSGGGLQSSTAAASTPQSVALQSRDLPAGLQRCPASGEIGSYLNSVKSQNPNEVERVQAEWDRLRSKEAGGQEGAVALFSQDPSACSLTSLGLTGGAPQKLAGSLVFKFKDEGSAARAYQSGLLGFKPSDLRQVTGVTQGGQTGLGANSTVLSTAFSNQSVYLALWQAKSFEVLLLGANLEVSEGKQAATAVSRRIH